MNPYRVGVRLTSALLVVGACTSAATETTLESPEPEGRLVVIDDGLDVVTMDPDGSNQVGLTSDGGDDAFFFQPTWSSSSDYVAWGQGRPEGLGLGFAKADGSDRVNVSMANLPFYFYWSPNDDWIAALHNGPEGLDLEMVDVSEGSTSVVGRGAPFYFSWNPRDSEVIAHVGDDRFELIQSDGTVDSAGETGVGYQTPQWTDRGVFHLRDTDLVLAEPDGSEQVVASVPGSITFVANTEGSQVALQAPGGAQAVTAGLSAPAEVTLDSLFVLDVESGDVSTVTDELALGYFWSPDGETLLVYVSSETGGAVDLLVWNDGKTSELVTYEPHPSFFNDVLPFFTQYALSLRVWSPDSNSVAYAGSIDERAGIWTQAISGDPVFVTAGNWVAWSSN